MDYLSKQIIIKNITSRNSSSADFFGFNGSGGNGFLKTKAAATLSSAVSVLGFFASISSGISSVVLVRFLLLTASTDGLKITSKQIKKY
jgi:hypothetical protein